MLVFTCDVNNMVIKKQMMMHINWLMELYTDIRMLGWWFWCWWSYCMCNEYMWCMFISMQPIWISCDSAISHPYNTVTVPAFVINVLSTDTPCTLFLCSLLFYDYCPVLCTVLSVYWVVYEWPTVYVIIIIACAWLFLKLH